MVDIGGKKKVTRLAKARGIIELTDDSIEAIQKGEVKKGDVFQVAEISAIQAVKKTPESIPHCHPIPIEGIEVSSEINDNVIEVECEVKAVYKTGVEMEALAGVNAALLTIWDMVKYLEKDQDGQYPKTRIKNISILNKKKVDNDGP
ncbi:MAG: cyclic pyranopterin monophosphate synthase MoaC [Candidatus Thermoplasmatota archaeon]|nr:cyclic pyranopterin monophosphate synthase MoaC [Candidatus Thermoplasmatota archaeon]MBS3789305.1 cyclic pyranopterin monophosphate synthase MoaC [Candidatus Thermoplasmatota archaeon]